MRDFLDRLLQLVREDPELHMALIMLLKAKTAHERWLAELAAAKAKKLLGER